MTNTTPTTQREADERTQGIDLKKLAAQAGPHPLDGLADILREAAAILNGERALRFPIVDELIGFAGMVEHHCATQDRQAAPEAPAAATDQPSAGQVGERVLFEAWSRSKWKYDLTPARDESLDTYMEGETETAWMGFQAGRASLTSTAPADHLTPASLALLRKGLRDWETPENRYAAQRVLDAIESAPTAPQAASQQRSICHKDAGVCGVGGYCQDCYLGAPQAASQQAEPTDAEIINVLWDATGRGWNPDPMPVATDAIGFMYQYRQLIAAFRMLLSRAPQAATTASASGEVFTVWRVSHPDGCTTHQDTEPVNYLKPYATAYLTPATSREADQARRERENAEFAEWWSREQACPEHSLVTENAAHAAWQERGRRAALACAPSQSAPLGSNAELAKLCAEWKSGVISGQEAMVSISAALARAPQTERMQPLPANIPTVEGIPSEAMEAANALLFDMIGKREWDVPCAAKHIMAYAARAPLPAQGGAVAWMRNNRKECITAKSKQQMENAGFGAWGEVAASYTIPLTYLAAPAQADDARDAARREAWLIANPRWSVRWRIHTKKQIEQWQMVDDGESWGQWGDYRKVLDTAIAASLAGKDKK